MVDKLNVDQVKNEIERFWKALVNKESQTLLRFYSGGATVFNSSSKRHELGPLSAARREREYFQPDSKVKVEVGDIHVIVLGEHAESAVASYTFQFQASRVATTMGETDENIQHGRATHVFSYGPDGNLCIMHEHFSLPVENRSEAAVQSAKPDPIRVPS